MWSIRDAILLWLYIEQAEGRQPSKIDVAAVQRNANWAAEPITNDECRRDARYLMDENLMDAKATWGDDFLRPRITANGQRRAAAGESARPGLSQPAQVTGITNHYNITNNAPSNTAIGSTDVTQTVNTGADIELVHRLAILLDRLADQRDAQDIEGARSLAADLREQANEPAREKSALLRLIGRAITAFAGAAGTVLADEGMQVATEALQAINS